MNAHLTTQANDIRALSADELDLVSGGEVKFVDIGPIHIAVGDGLFALAISGSADSPSATARSAAPSAARPAASELAHPITMLLDRNDPGAS